MVRKSWYVVLYLRKAMEIYMIFILSLMHNIEKLTKTGMRVDWRVAAE